VRVVRPVTHFNSGVTGKKRNTDQKIEGCQT
jgi:hypothetical protein